MNRINSMYQSPVFVKNYQSRVANYAPSFKQNTQIAQATIDTVSKNRKNIFKCLTALLGSLGILKVTKEVSKQTIEEVYDTELAQKLQEAVHEVEKPIIKEAQNKKTVQEPVVELEQNMPAKEEQVVAYIKEESPEVECVSNEPKVERKKPSSILVDMVIKSLEKECEIINVDYENKMLKEEEKIKKNINDEYDKINENFVYALNRRAAFYNGQRVYYYPRLVPSDRGADLEVKVNDAEEKLNRFIKTREKNEIELKEIMKTKIKAERDEKIIPILNIIDDIKNTGYIDWNKLKKNNISIENVLDGNSEKIKGCILTAYQLNGLVNASKCFDFTSYIESIINKNEKTAVEEAERMHKFALSFGFPMNRVYVVRNAYSITERTKKLFEEK